MPEVIISDYFYGDEAEMFQYFRIPKQIITDERFKGVSTDAKLLYGMLLDRMSLSVKNQWFDKDGRVYIYYTVEEICQDMTCGRDKAMKLLAELDKGKGIGLIERIRQGQGKPTKIYVKRFTTRDIPPVSEVENSNVQKSDFPTSRSRDNRPQEVGKTDSNHTENNYPDFIQPDPSTYPLAPLTPGTDRWRWRDRIKENIDYEYLCRSCPRDDVDSLLELMADVLTGTTSKVRIGGTEMPAEVVKRRFLELDSSHIEYVIEAMRQTTTKIHNIRAYLLTALYNAPVTIGPYYSAAVRHDFGG